MAAQNHRPDGKTFLAAVTTVAALYVYFLIFAQFGFLKAVQATLGAGPAVMRPVMTVMGLAGITGSVAAAWIFSEQAGRRRLALGFALGGAAAVWSMRARSPAEFYGVALLVGLGVGLATVTLAAMLRRAAGAHQLGIVIGLGTGLAYGLCNLPGIFDADARMQAGLAVLAAAVGLAGAGGLAPRAAVDLPAGGDYARGTIAVWVIVFLILVGLDSAVFYFIQHMPDLKESLWTGTGRQWLNAGMHLGGAAWAGWSLDRRGLGRTIWIGAGALVVASGLIVGRSAPLPLAGLLYVAGVSIYSTALVFYPARSGRPGVAALIYAVAGWGGSALGIGLAEGRASLPPALIVASGAILAAGFIGWRLASRREQTMNENSRP